MVGGISSLDRKLLRDLWRLRTQVIAIALVVASGAALLIMARTTVEALEETTQAYYERYRFADVFALANRAPEPLVREIATIADVQAVETRIVEFATLDIPGFGEPVTGQMVSLPAHGAQVLNMLALQSGRLAAPDRPDEVVLNAPFAEAHDLRPGDSFQAILRGSKRTLQVVGTALSPEFVYAIQPGGLMPDDRRFGIIWMGRASLAAAYDLDEAFNDVSLKLMRGADPHGVIAQLDRLLQPYGGTGAYARSEQLSNWFLQNEITQQKNMSSLLPAIFLAVAAFLTNMVMARLIATERREIGLLKAFGYRNLTLGWHYAKMVLAIGGIGVVLGAGVGAALGHWNTELYAQFYRFPFLLYRPGPSSFAVAALVSLAAALAGSLTAVSRAVTLPPAEAMQQAAPPVYRRGWLARTALNKALDEPTRMIFRRLMRWPLRALLASTGLAMSVAVLVMAFQWIDAVDELADSYFQRAQHQDATVTFVDLQPMATIEGFKRLPGVLAAEPFRGVAARLSNGRLSERQSILGIPAGATLSPATDADSGLIELPPDGLMLSRMLADMLQVGVGDTVTVAVLEGRRPVVSLPVARIFESYIGTPAYMDMAALNRLMMDGRVLNGLNLAVDASDQAALLTRIKDIPNVAATLFRQAAIDKFYETMGQTVFIFVGFFIVFATTLSVGVTYNSIRIALSERARELATLRVLGFSRWEISYILLGEIGIITWLAIPLGCLMGFLLAWYFATAFETELFRIPLAVSDATYGQATLIALAATLVCAAIVRRRLDRLDLVGVLKTRD